MSGEQDDVQGEQIEVLWDAEIGARVLEEDAWSRVGKRPASLGCPGRCSRRKIEAPFAPRLHLRDLMRGWALSVIAAVRGCPSRKPAAATCSLSMNYSRGNPHLTSTASMDARRASSNIGCNGALARLRRGGEFSYVASRSEDIDL